MAATRGLAWAPAAWRQSCEEGGRSLGQEQQEQQLHKELGQPGVIWLGCIQGVCEDCCASGALFRTELGRQLQYGVEQGLELILRSRRRTFHGAAE